MIKIIQPIFKNNIWPKFSFFLIFIVFASLLSLGFWQLQRLEQKNNFIKSISALLSSDFTNIGFGLNEVKPYEKITIDGKFLDQNIFLYGRRSAEDEKHGYYLLKPFQQADSGKTILVSRGWVSASVKEKIENNQLTTTPKTKRIYDISGITMPGEKGNIILPKNDLTKNIWFFIDLAQAKEHFGININNFFLMELEHNMLGDSSQIMELDKHIRKHNPQLLLKIRNDHFEYAITWFALAFASLLIFAMSLKNNTPSEGQSE